MFGYASIMVAGRRLIAPVLLLALLLTGCTATPPAPNPPTTSGGQPNGITVPPPVPLVADDLAGYRNLDLCQIIEQTLPDGLALFDRPAAPSGLDPGYDTVPTCTAAVNNLDGRLNPRMKIAVGTHLTPSDLTGETSVVINGASLGLSACQSGQIASDSIYVTLNDDKLLSVTFTIMGGPELAPPNQDEVQQLCDQVAAVATAFEPRLADLPRYDDAVAAHDPCVPIVKNAKAINADKIARANGENACDAAGGSSRVRVVYGVPLAGDVQGDVPTDRHVTVAGTDVAVQENGSVACQLTWQAFPNAQAAEQGATVQVTGLVAGGSPGDLCATAQSFTAAAMRDLKG